MKGQIMNFEDKQIVFPEDDDSDIIIVNEDISRNTIDSSENKMTKDNVDDIDRQLDPETTVFTTTKTRYEFEIILRKYENVVEWIIY